MTSKQIAASKIIARKGTITGKELKKIGYKETRPVKVLKTKSMQDVLQKALKKHKITIDKAIAPIADGLTATKVTIVGKGEDAFAEETTDHATRLKASAMSLKLLGVDDLNKPSNGITQYASGNDNKELIDAIKSNADDVELQRIVFKGKDND